MKLTRDQFTIRPTATSERSLMAYSHSIVEAVNTCPVWGLVRYVEGKAFYSHSRTMALEAGSAMHDVFSAVRLWQLYRLQGLYEHFRFHGGRLYGPERFAHAWKLIPDSQRDELIAFAYNILNTSGYFDDPNDRIRTLSHMEETTIRYVDELMPLMSTNPIWVYDVDNPTAPIGIEVVFDMIVEVDDPLHPWTGRRIRYIGTIDGIIQRGDGRSGIRIDENKTASRVDATWRDAYRVKSQPRGYGAVAEVLTGQPCNAFRVIGVKVQQSRSGEDFLTFNENIHDHHIESWATTLFSTDETVALHRADPLNAPKFTHSCSRYFRSCAFLDLCAADPEDQEGIYASMVEAEPTPSQRRLQELYRNGKLF